MKTVSDDVRVRRPRVEAIDARCGLPVGADHELIVEHSARLLGDETTRRAMTAFGNPFGDGQAARRAAQAIAWLLGLDAERAYPSTTRAGLVGGLRSGDPARPR